MANKSFFENFGLSCFQKMISAAFLFDGLFFCRGESSDNCLSDLC